MLTINEFKKDLFFYSDYTFSLKAKFTLIALTVGIVAGAALTALGALYGLTGSLSSLNFIFPTAAGGVFILASVSGILAICKKVKSCAVTECHYCKLPRVSNDQTILHKTKWIIENTNHPQEKNNPIQDAKLQAQYTQVLKKQLTDSTAIPSNYIFGGENNVLCLTANQGKLSDVSVYVNYQTTPLMIDCQVIKQNGIYGLTPIKAALTPKSCGPGHCMGNVTFFLQQWKVTQDSEKISEMFKDGSPIQGAIYQELYQSLEFRYCPNLVKWIQKTIETYPHDPQKRQKWRKNALSETIYKSDPDIQHLLDGITAYLGENHKPKEGGLVNFVNDWHRTYYNRPLPGSYLAAVTVVEAKYLKRDLQVLFDCHQKQETFGHANLNVEHFYHTNSKPGDVLRTLSKLNNGLYYFNIPAYSPEGKLMGTHAVGLIIDSEECYILDSNFAIGRVSKQDLTDTMGRLFSCYTFFDYSMNLDGHPMTSPTTTPPDPASLDSFQLWKLN